MTSRTHVSTSQIEVPFSHLVQRDFICALGIDSCIQPSTFDFVLSGQLHSSSFDLHLLVGQPGERHQGFIHRFLEFCSPRTGIRGSFSTEAVCPVGGQYIYNFGVHTRLVRIPNFSLVLASVDGLSQRWNIHQQQQKKLWQFHGLVASQDTNIGKVFSVDSPIRPSKATASTAHAHGKRSAGAGAGRAGASSGVGLSLASPHGNHGERLGMVVDRSFLPGVAL